MKCVDCPNEVSPRAKNTRGQCTKCSARFHDSKRRSSPVRREYMRNIHRELGSVERLKEWSANNPDKVRAAHKAKKKKKPGLYRSLDAKRRASELRAMPPWADKEAIKKIYAECPEGYHVDHIVPLNNPNVCGLHVPANLRAIPAAENLKKGNRFNG